MYIRIERGAATPISRQIAEQVRAQCLAGLLRPGDCLPSVRQLASELVVNVNTVVRVYEKLAAEGLLEMRHGEGTFVLPQTTTRQQAAELKQQRQQFLREFQAIVRRGLLLGLTANDLRRELTAASTEVKNHIAMAKDEETKG
ncbi:GntR family transcriptional regulator [Bremerella cremea]|uniref:GntR family transcriptional regulator n=1 Tax=Bremerella cremea TaxID=1031537 RepID=A0A368KQJ4_9BACT|nr:GntR family transcriptional regulator [Bremerella cremea]RCS48311.1 GntR family transcriptional regulator [Bremerella cremea]